MQTNHKYTILVVEDELLFKNLIAGFLSKYYDISMTGKGKEALSICDKIKIDLVLLDIRLPDIDGYEVTRRLKNNKNTQDIPIILLTGIYISPENQVVGFEKGADDYLIKGNIDQNVLMAHVEKHISIKLTRDLLKEKSQKLEKWNQYFESYNISLKETCSQSDQKNVTNRELKHLSKKFLSDLDKFKFLPNISDKKIEWKKQIAKGLYTTVIPEIIDYTNENMPDSNVNKSAILISARSNDLTYHIIDGTLSQEEIATNKIKIVKSLLELIELL